MQVFFNIFFLSLSLNVVHPFYVSICEINQNKTDQTLEVTIKIFSEDLEQQLKATSGEKINIGMSSENKKTNEYIKTYLQKELSIIIDEKPAELTFIGKEVEEDATWIYMEIKKVKKPKSVKVINTILLDYQDSQTNIVHLNIEGKKKSMLLNNDKHSDVLLLR